MSVLRMIIVGLIVGVLARFFYPGAVHMSWLWSIVLGVGGSFLAGFIGNLAHPAAGREPMHPAGFLYSILGAMLLIFVARHFFHLV